MNDELSPVEQPDEAEKEQEAPMANGNTVKTILQTKDWIWLVTLVAGATAASIGGQHKMASDMRDEMIEMDRRWQERTERLQKEIRVDLADIKKSIPPDWFRAMVETNKRSIEQANHRIDTIRDKMAADDVREARDTQTLLDHEQRLQALETN